MSARIHAAMLLLPAALLIGCRAHAPAPPQAIAAPTADAPRDLPGLPNVISAMPGVYSGGIPHGEEGFRTLRDLGVKTVISVEAARPEIALAQKYGLRYVHSPIGYDGVPREQALRMAAAVQDLPGPFFIHCRHGKHRSPAAAAAVRFLLDPSCTVADTVAFLKRAGTAPHYTGLYAVGETVRPTQAEFAAVPRDFPSAVTVSAAADIMTAVEHRWENIRAIRAAGGRTPPDHPDLEPTHEAGLLAEHFRDSARLMPGRPARFNELMRISEAAAHELAAALKEPSPAKFEAAFGRIQKACVECHRAYRDVPLSAR
jgi:hypothetical protein